jgi:hypothetical protein
MGTKAWGEGGAAGATLNAWGAPGLALLLTGNGPGNSGGKGQGPVNGHGPGTIPPGLVGEPGVNDAAKECKAQAADAGFAAGHEGHSFAEFYGTNDNDRNAFGKCVSQLVRERNGSAGTGGNGPDGGSTPGGPNGSSSPGQSGLSHGNAGSPPGLGHAPGPPPQAQGNAPPANPGSQGHAGSSQGHGKSK